MKYFVTISLAALLSGSAFATDNPPTGGASRGPCRADVEKLCPNVQPGGGRIIACLKQNKNKVSDSCKSMIEKARAKRNSDDASAAKE
jgi:hypothetical protein